MELDHDAQETLQHLALELSRLKLLARATRADIIGYMIEMAEIEVEDILKGQRPLSAQCRKRSASADNQMNVLDTAVKELSKAA